MGATTMAAILVMAEVAILPVREPLPPPRGPVLRMSVAAVDAGDGGSLVEAGAAYAAGRTGLSLAARWRRTGVRGWPDAAEASFAVDRALSARQHVGLEVWQGLTRAGGGLGVAITLRGSFR